MPSHFKRKVGVLIFSCLRKKSRDINKSWEYTNLCTNAITNVYTTLMKHSTTWHCFPILTWHNIPFHDFQLLACTFADQTTIYIFLLGHDELKTLQTLGLRRARSKLHQGLNHLLQPLGLTLSFDKIETATTVFLSLPTSPNCLPSSSSLSPSSKSVFSTKSLEIAAVHGA